MRQASSASTDPARARPRPQWFDDAKLGVFVHWGPYSVPGWGRALPRHPADLRDPGAASLLPAQPVRRVVREHDADPRKPDVAPPPGDLGIQFPVREVRGALRDGGGPARFRGLGRALRARGRALRPCSPPSTWMATRSGRARTQIHGSRAGVRSRISSGQWPRRCAIGACTWVCITAAASDVTFNDRVIRTLGDCALAVPQSEAYARYCEAQLRELIERYRPDVLWNDVGFPTKSDLVALLDSYYRAVPNGVANDRWARFPLPEPGIARAPRRHGGCCTTAMRSGRSCRGACGASGFGRRVSETTGRPSTRRPKMSLPTSGRPRAGSGLLSPTTRARARAETLSLDALVHLLVDVVSKNGNLLIGVGPMADGTIPRCSARAYWASARGSKSTARRCSERARGAGPQPRRRTAGLCASRAAWMRSSPRCWLRHAAESSCFLFTRPREHASSCSASQLLFPGFPGASTSTESQ